MGKVVEKKKKKKGRPSLLDLQKRTLREQQQQQQQQQLQKRKKNNNHNSAPHSNPNYTSATRRSTRRNPNPDDEDNNGENDDVSDGKRREKKLKLVVKLPPNSVNLNSGGSESDDGGEKLDWKGKINGGGAGSRVARPQKGEKSVSAANPSSALQGGTKLDSGPSTHLPDQKLLMFVLDRLQKKDTYGVFSEPVDPNELPDYHEVIEHPMDFGTVKKKLTSGVYTSLEQFEDDIFLICSNAMQYNAPDTIYFRQARSIQELAEKNFQNLRQDSDDDNEPEPQVQVKRRGRPPTKNLKKPLGRPPLDRAGSGFSDATLATGAANTTLSKFDLRKGPHHLDKSHDAYNSRLADNKLERTDDFTGSMSRGNSKLGKKQFLFDENRRNTYNQSHPSAGGRESSVLTTFDGERKQLMAVGLHSDYGYSRSLARFAANLGPVWTVAAKKIERSLTPGVKFGPGWVGQNDVTPHRLLLLASSSLREPPSSEPFPIHATSSSSAPSCPLESNRDKLPDKPSGHDLSGKHGPSIPSAMEGHIRSPLPLPTATSSTTSVANKSPEPITGKAETVEGLNSRTGFNMVKTNIGVMRPSPPFQIHQNSATQPGINGVNGTYGLNLPAQMGKPIGVARPGGFNFQSSQMPNRVSRTNANFVHPATSNSLRTEATKFPENPGTINSSSSFPSPVNHAPASQTTGIHTQPSSKGMSQQQKADTGLSPQQKPDSVPPDLNVRFLSPGSPSSSRADSTQPDLALQL